jgi:hypothetical protein
MSPPSREDKEQDFARQRAKAMETVQAITNEHQTALALKMEELGLAPR